MITKNPSKKYHRIDNIYYTSAARVGFKHLLQSLQFQRGEKILLPAYIGITDREGSGVLDPIEESGVDYEFYPINKTLSVNEKEFELKCRSNNIKAALIIHYFGFLQSDIKRIQGICQKNNIILVEDCAHALYSSFQGTPLGNFGDFSFFSIHKLLPTDDGGILKINNTNYRIPPIKNKSDTINQKTLELYIKSKSRDISSVRVHNYLYLCSKLRAVDGITILYPTLPEGIVPMNFPILVGKVSREMLYFKLMEEKIPTTALYYRLINTIDKKSFPDSYSLSQNILNLPIHQDITERDLNHLVNTLVKSLNSLVNDKMQ